MFKSNVCSTNEMKIDIRLKQFDQLVVPVILYGCEILGDNNIDKLEKLHSK